MPGGVQAALPRLYHVENTTFRLDLPNPTRRWRARGPYADGRFLVRIHRPRYQTRETILSELEWLAALRRQTDIAVPEPVPARGGELLVAASADGVPESRFCSVLRWMNGRGVAADPDPHHFRLLGRTTAKLHAHASSWRRPASFRRARWDHDGLFFGNRPGGERFDAAWEQLPAEPRRVLEEVSRDTRQVMRELGNSEDVFGLIHADLHLENVFFHGDSVRVIDFDDCGEGYWVYDAAVTLFDYYRRPDWIDLRDAWFEGYQQERALSSSEKRALPTMMAARGASLALWGLEQSTHNPTFASFRAKMLPWILEQSEGYLRGDGPYSRRGPRRRPVRSSLPPSGKSKGAGSSVRSSNVSSRRPSRSSRKA